ncbi:MAG: HicB family protein [Clostridiales bacterium]|nr:HicB family protein [Clostridiales bacterium]
MKCVYPIILTKGSKYIIAFVPDFNISTQGENYATAIEMARDAIGLMGIDMEDDGEKLPTPTEIDEIKTESADDLISLVDVNFTEYRKKNDTRSVRRNVTIPAWLDYEVRKHNINVSATLRSALELRLAE